MPSLNISRLLRSLVAHLRSAKGAADRTALADALFAKNALVSYVVTAVERFEKMRAAGIELRSEPVVPRPSKELRREHQRSDLYDLGLDPVSNRHELATRFRQSLPPFPPSGTPKNASSRGRKEKR